MWAGCDANVSVNGVSKGIEYSRRFDRLVEVMCAKAVQNSDFVYIDATLLLNYQLAHSKRFGARLAQW